MAFVQRPPPVPGLLAEVMQEKEGSLSPSEKFLQLSQVGRLSRQKYMHWDVVSRLDPPEGLTNREWWLALKLGRQSDYRALPLVDAGGAAFVYALPDEVLELLHYVDQHAAGEVAMTEAVVEDREAKTQYLVNSLIEEAIRSSQLEGAATTRRVAKEMIRTGRKPSNRSERMILNNYRALEFMRDEVGDRLEPATVLALHRILTEGTLDNPDAAGRLQTPDEDRVMVADPSTDAVLHRPPPAEQLEERLSTMCAFANGDLGPDGFIHPVVRAVLLHFWLAFDHPFEDGNGRTARALFYWSMRTQGYWATEYLSISKILRQGPSMYRRSFLYTETDDRDTTYFLIHQLNVIQRAIREFQAYLRRKMQEIKDFEVVVRDTDGLNHRQLALLRNAVRNANQTYTFKSHQRSHNVSFESARSDLTKLWTRDLLKRRKVGNRFLFSPAEGLATRLTDGNGGGTGE